MKGKFQVKYIYEWVRHNEYLILNLICDSEDIRQTYEYLYHKYAHWCKMTNKYVQNKELVWFGKMMKYLNLNCDREFYSMKYTKEFRKKMNI